MRRLAHPRPEAVAIARCDAELPGFCICKNRRAGFPPGQRINRHLCEDRYQAGIQAVIEQIRKDDPAT